NISVLDNYRRQIEELNARAGLQESVPLQTLLLLPGAVDENPIGSFDPLEDWPLIRKTLIEALEHLSVMRRREGEAMEADLKSQCAAISAELSAIEARAPHVVEGYRNRLH